MSNTCALCGNTYSSILPNCPICGKKKGSNTDKLQEQFTIEQMRQALSRFCNGKYRMCVPAQPDDDDMILSYAIDQLEQAQATIEEQKSNYSDLEDELERINNHLFDSCKQFEQAQAANQKLVECLEWYGDEVNYEVEVVNQWAPIEPVSEDRGQRARQTLSEVKGNVGDS